MYDKALLPSNTFLVLPVNQSNILKVTVRKNMKTLSVLVNQVLDETSHLDVTKHACRKEHTGRCYVTVDQ